MSVYRVVGKSIVISMFVLFIHVNCDSMLGTGVLQALKSNKERPCIEVKEMQGN